MLERSVEPHGRSDRADTRSAGLAAQPQFQLFLNTAALKVLLHGRMTLLPELDPDLVDRPALRRNLERPLYGSGHVSSLKGENNIERSLGSHIVIGR
jgi:hypothetical protein